MIIAEDYDDMKNQFDCFTFLIVLIKRV